jgi:hypothetical protein
VINAKPVATDLLRHIRIIFMPKMHHFAAFLIVFSTFFAPNLRAQPKSVEMFGQIGKVRLGGDEGSVGGATSYGGALMLPFAHRWAVDVDAFHARRSIEHSPGMPFSVRRTLVIPGIVRRWGTEKVYGFAGGGLGLQHDRSESVFMSCSLPDVCQPVWAQYRDTGRALHGKLGVVGAVTPRLLIRGDVFMAFRYVLPNIGVRIGIGYRF